VAVYAAEADMARRHLEAWLWADTCKERLQRAYGLPDRGPFVDSMESDDEWEGRAE